MKHELRDAWVADLRSGKHRQERGCCLGRLCEVTGIKPVFIEATHGHTRGAWAYDYQRFGLPAHLRSEAKISGSQEAELQSMNDTGFTFAEIANWIEANIPVED